MKVTEEHIEFVAQCIKDGDKEGDDAVYVDVALIASQFVLPYSAALKMMRHCVKHLGHKVIRRNLVSTIREDAKPAQSKMDRMMHEVDLLMQTIGENVPK